MVNEQVMGGAQRKRLDPFCSGTTRLLAITDTNALFSSLVHDCRRGRPSRLRKMTTWSTSVLYAPDHVYDEVYEHLADIAECRNIPVAELRTQFEEHYLPILRFVTIADEEITDPRVLAITDRDDVPTGQLASLISPCVVFSDDKHLRKPGFAVADWPSVAGHAVDMAEGVGQQNAASGLVVAPGYAVSGLVRFIGRRLDASPWLIAGIGVAVALFLLADTERRTRVGRALEKYGVPIMQELAEMVAEGRLLEQSGAAGLSDAILPVPSEPSLKQQIAIILARQSEPLLARDIRDLIQEHFCTDLVPSVTEILAVLRSNPEFELYQRYRWELGRYLAPQSEAA